MTLNIDKKVFDTRNPVLPIGSKECEVYFLTSPPQYLNVREKTPLSSDLKSFFTTALRESGLLVEGEDFTDRCRMANSMIYRAIRRESGLSFYRAPTETEIKELAQLNHKDLEMVKPKLIVALGSVALKVLGLDSSKVNRGDILSWEGVPVVVAGSLNKIARASTERTRRLEIDQLLGDFIRSRNYLNGNDISDNLQSTLEYEKIDAFDIDQVQKIPEMFSEYSEIILDYEASGLDTYIDGFHLGGMGICSPDRKKSAYIYFYHFERFITEAYDLPEENLKILSNFLKSKELVVYNKIYETSVTVSAAAGLKVNIDSMKDVLMWLRCLGKGSSLKQACVRRLGCRVWNDAVEDWIDAINTIVKLEKPTATMKAQRDEIEWLRENGTSLKDIEVYYKEFFKSEVLKEMKRIAKGEPKVLKDLFSLDKETYPEFFNYLKENKKRMNSSAAKNEVLLEISNNEMNLPEELTYEKGRDLFLKKKDVSVLKEINKIIGICESYFAGDHLQEINSRLVDYVIRLLDNYTIFESASYADLPLKIAADYCILDCHYTALLRDNVEDELKRRNLLEASQHYDDHAYLAYIIGRNGIAFDDELAEKLEDHYLSEQLECLRSLLTLPKMKDILKLNVQDLLVINSTTKLDELKSFFNPMSSYPYKGDQAYKRTSTIMSKLLGTTRFKFASMLYDVYEYSTQLVNPEDTLKAYPTLYPIYLALMKNESTVDKIDYLENLLSKSKEIDELMLKHYKRRRSQKATNYDLEVKTKMSYKDWNLDSISEEVTTRLYKVFKDIFGINPDHPDGWPIEFRALYFFKIYKKIDKSNGTYINGEIGRKSAQLIKQEEAEQECPLRLSNFGEKSKKPGEIYLLRTSWGACTATTKRWQAAQHTVPKATELMDLRTTRYLDGIKLHYDYSQAEVRVLAKLANDENLLKAFESGLDIHLHNASVMWGKDPSEVSSAERSMAKGVTFSLLYGTSISEFANKYTKGNIAEAREIIGNFFKSYPEVEKFIRRMHIHGGKKGWVPSLFGDPVFVDTPIWFFDLCEDDQNKLIINPYDWNVIINSSLAANEEKDRKERAKLSKAFRNSQNYCIQNTSSMLSGLAMNQFQKRIEKDDLSVKIECFTHDSCDSDLRIKDLLPVLKLLPEVSIDYIMEDFGIPMKIDYEIGVSNNKMLELEDTEIKGNIINTGFKGKKSSLLELINKFEENGVKTSHTIEESEDKILSIEQIFLTQTAYASALGKPYSQVEGHLTLEF